MSQNAQSTYTFHVLYRTFFLFIDPIICIWGAAMDFFYPALVLSSHIPNATLDMGHIMILKQRGGGMLNFGMISAVLLRYSQDLNIWKIVQVGIFIVDVTYCWAVYEALTTQGRLAVGTWRKEDFGSLAITGIAGLVRLAFLADIGLKKAARPVAKNV